MAAEPRSVPEFAGRETDGVSPGRHTIVHRHRPRPCILRRSRDSARVFFFVYEYREF